jgi:ribosomal protein S18 acetylase RimI-like enzyme
MIKKPLPSLDDIRTLTIGDWSQFWAFEEMANFRRNDTPADHAPPHWTQEEFVEYISRGEIIKGIFDQDEMIALYIFNPKEDELYVTEIVVHPDYRGQGLGGHLLNLAEEEAKRRNLSKCTLTVDPFNGRGLSVYFRVGYQLTGYKKAYYGMEYPQTDRCWMEKLLKEKRLVGNETQQVRVDHVEALTQTLARGFVGTGLIHSQDRNSRHNFVIFKKLKD